jgi:PBP1b-binding outer membrane lipoprotein LpoB
MSRKLLAVAALAIVLAGCVVVPARPVYYHPAPVVIY